MHLEYFHLIDRIAALNVGERTITVEAQVPQENTIFEGHFPGYPLMPGVLLIEAMAQTSGWLLIAILKFERMPFLAAVKEAKMRSFVSPGETLKIDAAIVHEGSGFAITSAKVSVGGELRCNATLTFRHVPFPNADLRGHMEAMAKRIGFPQQAIPHNCPKVPERPIDRSLDHRHWSVALARRRTGRALGRAQCAAHQCRREGLCALYRSSLGAGKPRHPDSQKGRPASDGSLAAHRYLCRRAGAGFRGDQGQQGNPGADGHDRRRRRRRARSRGRRQQ